MRFGWGGSLVGGSSPSSSIFELRPFFKGLDIDINGQFLGKVNPGRAIFGVNGLVQEGASAFPFRELLGLGPFTCTKGSMRSSFGFFLTWGWLGLSLALVGCRQLLGVVSCSPEDGAAQHQEHSTVTVLILVSIMAFNTPAFMRAASVAASPRTHDSLEQSDVKHNEW